ncbi:O-Antigen ligase [Rubripirellula lacrimiformis]|uniref:O-Antigen ligase n=1 Tax=Rubripirellula lacrimiformis TaxID=1930273 RepID=A0A517NHR5_9BACT|nr:O-antigen ligase family protein [Rubripirellula lacrimiformis]QDT06672.1 O-Antigen ligase [Rubripirellula lacrimiformis]
MSSRWFSGNAAATPPHMRSALIVDNGIDDPTLQRRIFGFIKISMWLLAAMAFTMPTTSQATHWEPLDSAKLLILAWACFGGAWLIISAGSWTALRRSIDPLMPFYAFLVWTLVSVIWSPLRSVTIAQSGSLVAMLFYATLVAIVSADNKRALSILKHLNWVLLISNAVVLVAYAISPEVSGLDRGRIHTGGDGLIHPTAAGATASLGLLLPVLCQRIGRIPWASRLILPSLVVHGSVLLLSNSRTAIGMAIVTIGAVLFWYSSNRGRAMTLLAAAMIAVLMLAMDPGFKLISATADVGTQYVSRGQSGDQIRGMSGRAELWTAIWQEYEKAMLVGHGYFVTSETGSLYVWHQTHNYTAHNLLLQILVSTGAIGLMIFLFALCHLFFAMLPLRSGSTFQRRIFAIVAVVAVWFLGWAQLGVSFMGPIRPESVVFFTLAGIGIGQLNRRLLNRSDRGAAIAV